VIQGEIVYHPDRRDVVENPCLILEVLSKSTQQYDQTDKFDAYRSILSLQEYVMVDQYSFWVKQFVKNDRNQWVFTELFGQEASLCLESVPLQLSLTTLYQRVQFEVEFGNESG
jgi:Uma2 family endonuclease